MPQPIPTIKEFDTRFPDDQTCVAFLDENGVFYTALDCPACNNPMKRYDEEQTFRCNRRSCKRRGHNNSIRKGTFFFESSLKCVEIMRLALFWLAKTPVKSTILLSGHSSETVSTFYAHFRCLVTSALRPEDQVIGGPGIVVEIDETKLGKRKYNRGHRVDGVWIVVGIERIKGGKIFLLPVENRSAQTLRTIIAQHVLPGSIVNTDLWKGYSNLEDFGLKHLTVNHSQTFKDPITKACTNTVEGLNSGLKGRIPVRNRTKNGIEQHLGEYVWRRQNKDRLLEAFTEALRDIHYEIE
jgi:transposase-like protein